jgi:ClpP class serine protease
MFGAGQAVVRGLADRIGTLDDTLARMPALTAAKRRTLAQSDRDMIAIARS